MKNIAKENYEACRQHFIDVLEELKNNISNENFENVDFDIKESLEYLSFLKKYANKDKTNSEPQKDNFESKAVSMFSISGEHLKDFNSLMSAARYIIENNEAKGKPKPVSDRISMACKQKVKIAFGYVWRFKSDTEENKSQV